MIVVTGASGQFGGLVVQHLLDRVSAHQLGVSVREPARVEAFAKAGVRVRQGDFTDPSHLVRCFEGATQVLIVSVNALGGEAVQQHAHAIEAARAAGVKRILYTSHQAASATSAVSFARDHAATEVLLQRSGVPFVALRNGFYAESAFYQLAGMKESGRLELPADGPVSWTARADLAAAAGAALLDTSLFDGISPPLTAADAVTFADVARFAGEILGRPVERVVVSDEDYRAAKRAQGFDASMVGMLASMFEATRAGEFQVTDPTLGRILGRKPTGIAERLRPYLLGSGSPH